MVSRPDSVAISKIKPVFRLDKPIFIGFNKLDLSKLLVYDFNYNHTKVKSGNLAKLLFSDTDSLVHEFETDEVYEDFYKDKDLFDFSEHPKNVKFWNLVNEIVVGNMKDETKRVSIIKFVGLKSKI